MAAAYLGFFRFSLVQTAPSLRLLIPQKKMDMSIRFLILVLLGLVLGGNAQVSVDQFLSQTETSLQELVKQVQANALNSCDLLSTCNAASTCSRLACPLTNANTTGYACQGVLQNTNCEGNCPWRNFDFSRSFLRVPGVNAKTINSTTPRQLRGICAQRNLDSLFQKYSNNTNFFRLYFGSVDGTFRIFPGMDESDCGSYDPRTRLWYLASTSNVKKAVMVLIDSGSSMAEIIPSTTDSNLATAFRITESFLDTTTEDDYVNIFTFDKNNVNFSSAQPVLVTDTSSHPDFGIFNATLSSPNQRSVPPGNGNVTDAISKVITSSAGFNNTNISSDYLKVIILITDSNEQVVDAINNAALPWDLIKNNSISVFLYMIPPSPVAIDASHLESQLCATRGYFEILDNTVFGNPLLALEAYYSFVAYVHSTYIDNGVDYSIEYQDYSAIDNRTFTLSKAVFSSNRELLGVAGIDIFKTKVQEVYGIDGVAIESAVGNRIISSTDFNSSRIYTISCLNQTSNTTCNQIVQASNIVCSSNFNTDITTLQKLSCCGTCIGADKPRNLRLALGLGLGLGILALIAVAIIVGHHVRRHRRPPPKLMFPGDIVNDGADS